MPEVLAKPRLRRAILAVPQSPERAIAWALTDVKALEGCFGVLQGENRATTYSQVADQVAGIGS